MASGDILIQMGAVSIGSGEVILAVLILGIVLLGVTVEVSNRIDAKRRERVLQAAYNYDIGEGVTLLQGVQAYFGNEGEWYVTSYNVYLFAGAPGGSYPRAMVTIDMEAWTLRVSSFEPCYTPEGVNQADTLVELMIQAAKGRGAGTGR